MGCVTSEIKADEEKRPVDSPLALILKYWCRLTGEYTILDRQQFIRLNTKVWSLYRLEGGESWPKFGSLKLEMILKLMSLLREEERWEEILYVELYLQFLNRPECKKEMENQKLTGRGLPNMVLEGDERGQCEKDHSVSQTQVEESKNSDLFITPGMRTQAAQANAALTAAGAHPPVQAAVAMTSTVGAAPPVQAAGAALSDKGAKGGGAEARVGAVAVAVGGGAEAVSTTEVPAPVPTSVPVSSLSVSVLPSMRGGVAPSSLIPTASFGPYLPYIEYAGDTVSPTILPWDAGFPTVQVESQPVPPGAIPAFALRYQGTGKVVVKACSETQLTAARSLIGHFKDMFPAKDLKWNPNLHTGLNRPEVFLLQVAHEKDDVAMELQTHTVSVTSIVLQCSHLYVFSLVVFQQVERTGDIPVSSTMCELPRFTEEKSCVKEQKWLLCSSALQKLMLMDPFAWDLAQITPDRQSVT